MTHSGHLVANSATIKGTLKAGSIIGEASIEERIGGFSYKKKLSNSTYDGYHFYISTDGFDTMMDGNGTAHSVSTGVFYIKTINAWGSECSLIMQGLGGKLTGTWTLNDAFIQASDQNLKHDIEPLSDKYSMFFDALEPKRFKYNDGTSDRYHIGFIAQEVYDAFTNARLDSQEVGAYVHLNESTYDKEHLGLRYSEFIALNTMQIQKAKSRITELENEVITLKEQVELLLNKE